MKTKMGGFQFVGADGLTHYQRNRNKYLENNKRLREIKRQHILSIKKNCQCVDCGNDDYRVLDFDHLGESPKLHNIADLVSRNWSIERIDEEIAKCDLRCANCHRIITHIRASIV